MNLKAIRLSDVTNGDMDLLESISDTYSANITWGDGYHTLVPLDHLEDVLQMYVDNYREAPEDYDPKFITAYGALERVREAMLEGAEWVDFEN